MICEIINPSDCYTLETDNFEAAAVAICLLGGGKLGLQSLDNDSLATPILFGWDPWLAERGITADTLESYLARWAGSMAAALESVLLGSGAERRRYQLALAKCVDGAERAKLREEWHDDVRSSLNDIGRAAWSYAARLRAKYEPPANREGLLSTRAEPVTVSRDISPESTP